MTKALYTTALTIFLLGCGNAQRQEAESIEQLPDSISSPSAAEQDGTPVSQYVVLGEEHNQVVENYNLLAQPEGLTKEQLQALATRARTELCQGKCNINLWDDFRAYDLDKKMQAEEMEASRRLTNQEIDLDEYKLEREQIAQEYYVKIADHLVAWLEFEGETIVHYPFQDSRYKELGGTNFKK